MEQLFTFKTESVRVLIDNEGVFWFANPDVCKILGYADPTQAAKKLDEDERMLNRISYGSGQTRKIWTVNEFGLYSLILSSLKPESKAFKRWVTHEVLPSLRKAGKYSTDDISKKEFDLQELRKKIEAKRNELISRESDIKELKNDLKKLEIEFWQLFDADPRQKKIFSTEIMDQLKITNQ